MKKFLLAFSLLMLTASVRANDPLDGLADISVSITSEPFYGSGIIKTRKIGNDNINFVWSVAHVIDEAIATPELMDKKTKKRLAKAKFNEIQIRQQVIIEDRPVARRGATIKVVDYSFDKDLVLYRIEQKNYTDKSFNFYLHDKLLPVRSEVWNVNCSNLESPSVYFVKSYISSHHHKSGHIMCDYLCHPSIPGCSGSGIFSSNGECIGLTHRSGRGFTISIPISRIVEWAQERDLMWAVDDAVPMISEEKLQSIMEKP